MKKIFTLLFLLFAIITANSQSTTVVISQVYGGGGGSAATNTYKQDFVELHNISTTTQTLTGYSLQYGSAAGAFSSVAAIPAGTSIPAGGYLLVSLGTVGTGGADFPVAADINLNLNLSATGGKILLSSQATTVGCGATATPCTLPSAAIVDLVSYNANNAEGGASIAALSGSTGAVRKSNGCQDTDNNAADFDVVSAPVPRNSATAPFSCSGASAATLSASPNISGLVTPVGNASAEASFNLSGSNLTGFPGNITVTPSADIQVSLTSGGTFSSSAINVPYGSATLASTPVYVRIAATAPAGAINGTVTLAGGGDADGASVTVSGSVVVAEPTVQATNVTFANIANNSFDVNWTNGNGSSRLVVVKQSAAAAVAPADGTNYTVGANTGTGNRVVYAGTGTGPVNVTGLLGGTSYDVLVYEYNGSAGSNNYLTTSATGNPATTTTTGVSPNLTQINFTSVATPQYTGAGVGNTRVPVMFFAKVSGLSPNTTYRYINQAQLSANFGGTALGAGNPILIDHTVSPMTYTYSTAPSITTAGGYGLFETDATGSFTGAFGFVASGNLTYFTGGFEVFPTIAVAEDVASPVIQNRFALNQSITVLTVSTTAAATEGSFIKGLSSGSPRNIVGLWSTIDGNLVAQRPLAMTFIENGSLGASWPGATIMTGYDQSAGAWNTVIPNVNANGVRLIQQFDVATGNVLGCNSDADGTWPSGAATTNPTGGAATPIQISVTDAPINAGSCFSILPVRISSFAVQKSGSATKIFWTTQQEINSREFVIERSTDGRTWTTVATVAAAGNSASLISYSTTDHTPAKGINFYRLRMVDLDNRFSTSEQRSVLFGNADVVLITPNPATTIATIYMGKADNSISQIFVTDMNGKLIERTNTADQTHTLQTARYSKGLYIVKVVNGASTSTHKLVVQ